MLMSVASFVPARCAVPYTIPVMSLQISFPRRHSCCCQLNSVGWYVCVCLCLRRFVVVCAIDRVRRFFFSCQRPDSILCACGARSRREGAGDGMHASAYTNMCYTNCGNFVYNNNMFAYFIFFACTSRPAAKTMFVCLCTPLNI